MAPKSSATATTHLAEASSSENNRERPPLQIVWRNVYLITALHGMALYGIYLFPGAKPRTWLWTWLCHYTGGFGVTVGAHRLWSHRSFKATWPLRNYKLLSIIFSVIIPITIPCYFWNESIWNGFFICYAFHYAFTLNVTWTVNSLAHIWGLRPYDENINPSENFSVVIATGGEGFHNFHHTFPQDYATSELGSPMNISKWFIDFCALFGLAYDLKTISKEAILKRRMRTGDLQHLKDHGD